MQVVIISIGTPHQLIAPRAIVQPSFPRLMACHGLPSFLLDAPPHRLWSQLVIQTEKVKKISGPLPRITIPMGSMPPKDLETGTHIPTIMMRFERTEADTLLIQSHIATNDRNDV